MTFRVKSRGFSYYSVVNCCSVAKSAGSSVLHYLSEFAQIHVPWVSVAIYPPCTVALGHSPLPLPNASHKQHFTQPFGRASWFSVSFCKRDDKKGQNSLTPPSLHKRGTPVTPCDKHRNSIGYCLKIRLALSSLFPLIWGPSLIWASTLLLLDLIQPQDLPLASQRWSCRQNPFFSDPQIPFFF